ncbi:MAG: diguanylate cyclase [Nitrospirota bacterium]|nr:diguanylate cyclase [Nitrospirota bacterium]
MRFPRHTQPLRVLGITAALTATVVVGMFYVVAAGARVYSVHLPLVDAAMVVRIEATLAHLALDELASGRYVRETELEMWQHLSEARWHLDAIHSGGRREVWTRDHSATRGDEVVYVPLSDPALHQALHRATSRLDELQQVITDNMPMIAVGHMSPALNQRVEGIFHSYLLLVDRMDVNLHRQLRRQYVSAQRTQMALVFGVTLLGVLAGVVLYRMEISRSRAQQSAWRAERHARENDRQLTSSIVNAVGEGVVAFDLEGRLTHLNRAAEKYICPEHPEESTHTVHDLCLGPCGGGRVEAADLLRRVAESGLPVILDEIVASCPHAATQYLEGVAGPLYDADGVLAGGVISLRDVTNRRRMEEALRASAIRHEQAQRIAHLGHWDWNLASGDLTWSGEVFRIFGYRVGEVTPSYSLFLERIHPDDREAVQRAVDQCLASNGPYWVEHRVVLPDGTERTVLEQGEITHDATSGQITHLMGTVHDITARKELEARLEELAITDGLTGLFNRRHFDHRLAEEFRRAVTYYDLPVSLLLLDVDHFKHLNDSRGHPAGDAVLQALGAMLRRYLRSVDVAARYGGEEMAVILPQTSGEAALDVAERLRGAIGNMWVDTGRDAVQVTVSIGVADPQELNLVSAEDWLQAADTALYEAKHGGRDRVVRARPMDQPLRVV